MDKPEKNKKPIELLAPGRDITSAMTAINCGAEAIYIGAEHFGARQAAGNSIEDIQKLVDYAHQFYARVYITLNTILFDNELAKAQKLVEQLEQIPIDGLIIQDFALAKLFGGRLPLIASTQTHNCSVDKVKFLEDAGFSRVILARELGLDEIADIRGHTSIELECFVHGALCVSYSGQCYMSYALGGRSGNRGQCAQPCRKLYCLLDRQNRQIGDEKYWLSLKDLNLSEKIGDLLDIGINSFKIEGRLKNNAYVANVTAYYRQLLDKLLAERNMPTLAPGIIKHKFQPDLARTFNRGYCQYNINGQTHNIGSIESPKALGQFIGKVMEIGKDYFVLDSKIELNNADGLCFFDADRELTGTVVNQVQGHKITPQAMADIIQGTEIYRNYDHQFNLMLNNSQCASRKIPIELICYESTEGIALQANDNHGNQATVKLDCEKEPAKNADIARQNIENQLKKMGNSIFQCENIIIKLEKPYFFPLSILNQLRRDLIEALLKSRKQNRPKLVIRSKAEHIIFNASQLDYDANIANHLARQFYQEMGVSHINPAAETGLDMTDKRVMTTKYCIRKQAGLCNANEQATPLILTDEQNQRFLIEFDCQLCQMHIIYEGANQCQNISK